MLYFENFRIAPRIIKILIISARNLFLCCTSETHVKVLLLKAIVDYFDTNDHLS